MLLKQRWHTPVWREPELDVVDEAECWGFVLHVQVVLGLGDDRGLELIGGERVDDGYKL